MVDATLNARSRTIRLKGAGERLERAAGGAITPGHLVTVNSSNALVVHPTANRRAAAIFAVENELLGTDIDHAYASNDLCQAEHFDGGDWVLALLPASATAVVEGDLLASNGDGTLVRCGTDYDAAIAMAMEAVDNHLGGSVARIMVAII